MYFFEIEDKFILKNINLLDVINTKNNSKFDNFNINLLNTEDGLIITWQNKINNKHNITIIKNLENINSKEIKVIFNNDISAEINKFILSSNSSSDNQIIKRISASFKKFSCIVFAQKFKILVFIYWHNYKKPNIIEIDTTSEILDFSIVNKNKKLKLHVYSSSKSISIYEINSYKNSNKFSQLKSKEIFVDLVKDQLTKINLIKNKQNVINLKISADVKVVNNGITNQINDNNIPDIEVLNNTNLNTKTNPITHFYNTVKTKSQEEIEKMKQEIVFSVNEKFNDEGYLNNLSDHILKNVEGRIVSLLFKYQNKLTNQIESYVRDMEKTIYEEKLLTLRIQKLTEFYEKL